MHLVADADLPYVETLFGDEYDITRVGGRELSRDKLQDADVLLLRSITRVDAALLENSRVRFVLSMTAGTDHMDTAWLDTSGIAWCSAPGFNAPPVADYVASVIAHSPSVSTAQKRAAIIGVGAVGSRVAEVLRIMGFECLLIDPPRARIDANFQSSTLDALQNVDVISVHTPLTHTGHDKTFHLLSEAILAKQHPGTLLINASRGAVIATDVLQKLSSHLLLALDVFEHEPRIDPLLVSKALIATPHLAGHSKEGKARGMEQLARTAYQLGFLQNAPQTIPVPLKTIKAEDHDTTIAILKRALPLETITKQLQETMQFDVLRLEYGDRHEFHNTKIVGSDKLKSADQQLLRALGFHL